MSASARSFVGGALVFAGAVISMIPGGAIVGIPLSLAGGLIKGQADMQRAKAKARATQLRAEQEQLARGITANTRGNTQTHNLIFGKRRSGGVIVALGTSGANNLTFHIGIAHSITHGGGCDGISAVYVNDARVDISNFDSSGACTLAPYSTSLSIEHHRGTGTQTADSVLEAVAIDTLTSYRRGIAWTRFTMARPTDAETFEKAYQSGIPEFSVELRGIRCYDPRLDSSIGGSGAQRVNDPATWTWSDNPALCALTYMIMAVSDGGMGISYSAIDMASAAAAANVCDETISTAGGSRSRYRCNLVLSTQSKRADNLKAILDTMAGVRVRSGATYSLYAGAWTAPAQTITPDWLADAVRIETRDPLDQIANAVRVTYDDASNGYQTQEAPPVLSATAEAQDGGQRLWIDLACPGVVDAYQAQYLGQIALAKARMQMTISVPCNMRGLDLQVWDTVNLSLPDVDLGSRTFRVVDWSWQPAGPVVTLQEENASVYGVGATSVPSGTGGPITNVELPAAPTGLQAVAGTDGVILTWVPATNPLVKTQVWRATAESGTYVLIATIDGNGFVDPVPSGSIWYYKVRSVDQNFNYSAFTAPVSGSVFVTDSGLNVTNLRLLGQLASVTTFADANPIFVWDAVTPPLGQLLRDYRVRIYDAGTSALLSVAYVAGPQFQYLLSQNSADSAIAGFSGPRRSFTVEVVARTVQGKVSDTPASQTFSNPPPELPLDFTITAFFTEIELKFTKPSDGDYVGAKVYMSPTSGFTPSSSNLVYSGAETSPIQVFNVLDGVTYYIRVVVSDVFGDGPLSAELSTTTSALPNSDTTPPSVPANLALSSAVQSAELYTLASLTATWDASTDDSGALYYELEYWTADSSQTTVVQTTSPSYTIFPADAGTTYHVQVRASDYASPEQNKSDYCTVVDLLVAGDTTPPANVTGATALPGLDKNVLAWANPADADFLLTRVYRGASAGFTADAGSLVFETRGSGYVDAAVTNGTAYYYKFATVDVSGNASAPSAAVGPATPFKISAANVAAYFASAAIGDAYIQNLDAAKITTGTLDANRIAAASITASKLAVSQLSAITADLGTITAGTITGALIRTAASGARVQLDSSNGLQTYNSGGTLTAKLAPDGSGQLGAAGSAISWSAAGAVTIPGGLITTGTILGPLFKTSGTWTAELGAQSLNLDGDGSNVYVFAYRNGSSSRFRMDQSGNIRIQGRFLAVGSSGAKIDLNPDGEIVYYYSDGSPIASIGLVAGAGDGVVISGGSSTVATVKTKTGVAGRSDSGVGVSGVTNSGAAGVQGIGVSGGRGVYGKSLAGGTGVDGESDGGYGGRFSGGSASVGGDLLLPPHSAFPTHTAKQGSVISVSISGGQVGFAVQVANSGGTGSGSSWRYLAYA